MLRRNETCASPGRTPRTSEGASRRPHVEPLRPSLLDLDAGAGLLELGLDRVGLLARDAFLHRLRSAVDQVLRLFEAETGDRADDLDHADLLLAGRRQHDVERRLLLSSRSAVTGRSRAGSRNGHRRRRRDPPLLFDLVLQLDELEDGHLPELVEDGVDTALCHYSLSFSSSCASWDSVVTSTSATTDSVGSAVGVCGSSAFSLSGGLSPEGAAPASPLAAVSGAASSPPSCSILASMRPTRFCSGALNNPTTAYSGAATAPSTWPRSWSSGGSFARFSTSAAVIGRPSRTPPRTSSTRVSRAAAPNAFATATGSPSDSRNAIAVGPSRSASRASAPAASAARRVSVFLTTVNRAPCLSSSVRRPSICGIVRPR